MFASRIRYLAALLLAGSLVLIPAQSIAETRTIKAVGTPGEFKWNPNFRHIQPGDKIKWKNTTEFNHKVVAYKGKWDKNTKVEPGESTTKRFGQEGVYKFRCTIAGHSEMNDGKCSGMCGTIHVFN